MRPEPQIGWNIAVGGIGGSSGPLSEETKEKQSKAQSGENNPMYGKKVSEETKEKQRRAHLEKKHTEESKEKMKGRIVSEETKEKQSKAQSGENNPMYGKKVSEEL